MSYCTPTKLWQYALPPDSLFEDHGVEPGAVGAVTHGGTGLGSLVVDVRSNPRDAWPVVLKCIVPGEIDSNYVNPGPEPQFQASYDGGVTFWWQPIKPNAAGVLVVQKGGFSLHLQNGTTGAPVTIGAGNASLVCTPLRAGGSLAIVVGSALGQTWFNGAVVLTVTGGTTAAQAATYLSGFSKITDYFSIVAGGTGAAAVVAAGLTPLPFVSFALNDTWSFSTAPSPDVLAAQQVAFDFLNSRWKSSFHFPLLTWDTGIEMCESVYARWFLVRRRGLDKHQDFKVFNPALFEEGRVYADGVATGQIHPTVTQTPTGATLFADQIRQIDPLSCEAGSFPI